jgi:hypothetical protein
MCRAHRLHRRAHAVVATGRVDRRPGARPASGPRAIRTATRTAGRRSPGRAQRWRAKSARTRAAPPLYAPPMPSLNSPTIAAVWMQTAVSGSGITAVCIHTAKCGRSCAHAGALSTGMGYGSGRSEVRRAGCGDVPNSDLQRARGGAIRRVSGHRRSSHLSWPGRSDRPGEPAIRLATVRFAGRSPALPAPGIPVRIWSPRGRPGRSSQRAGARGRRRRGGLRRDGGWPRCGVGEPSRRAANHL